VWVPLSIPGPTEALFAGQNMCIYLKNNLKNWVPLTFPGPTEAPFLPCLLSKICLFFSRITQNFFSFGKKMKYSILEEKSVYFGRARPHENHISLWLVDSPVKKSNKVRIPKLS
jgi:hypothetical protein